MSNFGHKTGPKWTENRPKIGLNLPIEIFIFFLSTKTITCYYCKCAGAVISPVKR